MEAGFFLDPAFFSEMNIYLLKIKIKALGDRSKQMSLMQ
jgi:hypothetical protein